MFSNNPNAPIAGILFVVVWGRARHKRERRFFDCMSELKKHAMLQKNTFLNIIFSICTCTVK